MPHAFWTGDSPLAARVPCCDCRGSRLCGTMLHAAPPAGSTCVVRCSCCHTLKLPRLAPSPTARLPSAKCRQKLASKCMPSPEQFGTLTHWICFALHTDLCCCTGSTAAACVAGVALLARACCTSAAAEGQGSRSGGGAAARGRQQGVAGVDGSHRQPPVKQAAGGQAGKSACSSWTHASHRGCMCRSKGSQTACCARRLSRGLSSAGDVRAPSLAACRRCFCGVGVPRGVAAGRWRHGKAPQDALLTAAQLLHRCRRCLLTTDCAPHAARLVAAAVHCAPSCHVLPAPRASSAPPPVKCAVMRADALAGALRPGDAVAGEHIPRVASLGAPAGAS